MTIQQNLLDKFTTAVFSPVVRTYTTLSTGSVETVPTGATTVVIECYGPGGGGNFQSNGGGGYCKSSYACTGGKTINFTVGGADGNTQGPSGATSGTLAITAMVANFGGSVTTNIGGTATGGNVTNTQGGNASALFGVNGGAGAGPLGGAGGVAPTGSGGSPGGGAAGTTLAGGDGGGGLVSFSYT